MKLLGNPKVGGTSPGGGALVHIFLVIFMQIAPIETKF